MRDLSANVEQAPRETKKYSIRKLESKVESTSNVEQTPRETKEYPIRNVDMVRSSNLVNFGEHRFCGL